MVNEETYIGNSEFSKFIRGEGEYTPEKKREIMLGVIDKACLKQRRDMVIPTGEFVIACFNRQPIDKIDKVSLEQMIDNAIGLTMQRCWNIGRGEK